MKKPIIRIHDLTTNEIIDREMNDAEFAQYQAEKEAEILRLKDEADAKAVEEADAAALSAAKQAGQNKLKALGLTDLEIAAITGA